MLAKNLKDKVDALRLGGLRVPRLCVILVGNHAPSQVYVAAKKRACQDVGFEVEVLHFPDTIGLQELQRHIFALNNTPTVDGILIQLPLPLHLDTLSVFSAIAIQKDVDGLHPENMGRMALGRPHFIPATALGIIELLRFYNIQVQGKHCVIVGRSALVGTPLSILLSRNQPIMGNATVTLTHSQTPYLAAHTQRADILISAIGQPHFIQAHFVREGAIVIDVGITRSPNAATGTQLLGDVDFQAVAGLTSAITPVPFGVGPMTIHALLSNTWQAFAKYGGSEAQKM